MMNIGASNSDDAFYRYKMPKLVAKIEGRGNGIKTNVVNNVDVAKALERPPEYVLKYFGCELGAQTNFDAKTGTSIVNGAHDNKKLTELLEGFIKKYVQCYSCGNPETQIKIKKDFIHLKCKACGFVSDVDMRHKLNTFILKNPPENKLKKEEIKLKKAEAERMKDAEALGRKEKKDKKEKDEKGEKKERKEKKEKKKQEADRGDENDAEQDGDLHEGGSDDDDVVWMTDTSAAAAQRRAQEQLTSATAAMVSIGNLPYEQAESSKKHGEKQGFLEQGEWGKEDGTDVLSCGGGGQAMLYDATTAAYVETLRAALKLGGEAVANTLQTFSVNGGLAGKLELLLQAIGAAEPGRLSTAIAAHKVVVAACAPEATSQLALLIALEGFVGDSERLRELAVALQVLYVEDVVSDDVILAWAHKVDAGKVLGVPPHVGIAVRDAIAPVLQWLDEGHEQGSEETE